MGFFDSQRVQQSGALSHEVVPGNLLYAAAGLTVFAAVEQDTGISVGQVVEQSDALIDAEFGPLFNPRIETTGRIHQHRRTVAAHLVMGVDTVDFCERHIILPIGFREVWPSLDREFNYDQFPHYT